MSASIEWTEWHLTETGWVRGAMKTENAMTTAENILGSILAFQYIEEHSGYGKCTHRIVKKSQRCDSEIAGGLLALHGQCPESL